MARLGKAGANGFSPGSLNAGRDTRNVSSCLHESHRPIPAPETQAIHRPGGSAPANSAPRNFPSPARALHRRPPIAKAGPAVRNSGPSGRDELRNRVTQGIAPVCGTAGPLRRTPKVPKLEPFISVSANPVMSRPLARTGASSPRSGKPRARREGARPCRPMRRLRGPTSHRAVLEDCRLQCRRREGPRHRGSPAEALFRFWTSSGRSVAFRVPRQLIGRRK